MKRKRKKDEDKKTSNHYIPLNQTTPNTSIIVSSWRASLVVPSCSLHPGKAQGSYKHATYMEHSTLLRFKGIPAAEVPHPATSTEEHGEPHGPVGFISIS
ncbi:hypothetical protein E2C01_083832 [Portunus trituberculatus]|uniref:Uncharacterized protein n=1 Tax=Portunus trituberculatus TaxID=210409 RepID=A0A5B7J7L4_PORTR|nr:hypothetical protein [Portunus trituberculatus]